MRKALLTNLFSRLIIVIALAGLAGCDNGDSDESVKSPDLPAGELQSIDVTCTPDVMSVNGMGQCTAIGTFRRVEETSPDVFQVVVVQADITNRVTWRSLNTNSVTVSKTGKTTAENPGFAEITATLDDVSGSDDIIVNEVQVVSLDVKPDTADVQPFCTQAFTATATFDDGSTLDVTSSSSTVWASSIPDSTVDSDGLATAGPQGTGQADISATFTDGQGNVVSDTAAMTVQNIAVASLCVEAQDNYDPNSAICVVDPAFERPPNVNVQFRRKLLYNNGTVCANPGGATNWSSTDIVVATVDQTGLASTLETGAGSMTDIQAELVLAGITGSHPLFVSATIENPTDVEVLPDFSCVGFFHDGGDTVPPAGPPPSPGSEQMKAEGVFPSTGPTCDFSNPDSCSGALNADTTWAAEQGFWDGTQCSTNLPTEMSPAGDFTPPAAVDANGVVTPTGQVRIGTACIVGTHTPTGLSDAGTVIVFPFADDAQRQEAGELCDQFEPLFQAGGEDGGAGALTQLISAMGQLLNPLFLGGGAP